MNVGEHFGFMFSTAFPCQAMLDAAMVGGATAAVASGSVDGADIALVAGVGAAAMGAQWYRAGVLFFTVAGVVCAALVCSYRLSSVCDCFRALKDGLGEIGKLMVAKWFSHLFDCKPKIWRMSGETLQYAGGFLMMAPLWFPDHFLLCTVMGNALRSAGFMVWGAVTGTQCSSSIARVLCIDSLIAFIVPALQHM